MTYLSAKVRTKKKYARYTSFVGAVFLIAVFWVNVKHFLFPVVFPTVSFYSATKETILIFPLTLRMYFSSHDALAAKNKALTLQVEHLENMVAEKEALLRESILQGGSLSRDNENVASSSFQGDEQQGVSPTTLVMYPLAEDITRVYSTILLSKGFKDGVTVGAFVYVRGNQFVCTVKEVYTTSSLCKLISASGEKNEGVTSSSSVTLSLVGRGGHFLADVARGTPIVPGEIVYLRSNPKLILGTVRQVLNNNQDTSWHVFVEGAYNPVSSSVFYVQP